ncbi:13615_t:CDS:1, partial [Gigaspora margarita]
AREAMNLQMKEKIKVLAKLTPKVKFFLDLKKEITAGKGKPHPPKPLEGNK